MKIEHIKGVDRVLKSLEKKGNQYPKRVVVAVGYTASYSLSVHENIKMAGKGLPRSGEVRHAGYDTSGRRLVRIAQSSSDKKGFYWDPQGKAQAKFLEQPAREHRNKIIQIIKDVTKATGDMENGLMFAGLFLQRTSQELVPVDTGNLKGSAFTKVDSRRG